ncbi:DUF4111 domain-containing protein [Candidatus Microgenomates bacterium]|nr:DUF4111 domain-containing protein [Candidatus Microgenomates bacterium]
MDCFNPQSSDVDFLVVVKDSLSISKKKEAIEASITLSSLIPNNLEFSVVTVGNLRDYHYPTPFELHYSNDWKKRYLSGRFNFEKQNFDTDLIAHIVYIKKRGVCLTGQPIPDVFPDFPERYFRELLNEEIKYSLKVYRQYPVYATLNMSRLLAYGRDKLILSKKEGGEWALKNLDKAYCPLIHQALDEYVANKQSRWNLDAVKKFIEYSRDQWQRRG